MSDHKATMTAAEVQEFLDRFKLSDRKAAEMFDISRRTVAKYREEGAPLLFAYACAAKAFGLPPYRGKEPQAA